MVLGFSPELIGATRGKGGLAARTTWGLVLLGLLCYQYETLRRFAADGQLSTRQVAAIALRTAEGLLLFQGVATLLLVPMMVAGVVADHRRRQTLPALLATPLTPLEILLGLLLARLIRVMEFLALGFPILMCLSLFGVDPGLTLAAYLGTASTALLLSAFSIAVAVHARSPRKAVVVCLAATAIWLVAPWLIANVPSFTQWGSWLRWINSAIYPTTPLYVLSPVNLFFWGQNGDPLKPGYFALRTMIGWQAAWGIAFLAVAALRLRPASRAGGSQPARQRSRWREIPRCGDDPVLWKECHGIGSARLARWSVLPVLFFFWLRWMAGWDQMFLFNYNRAFYSLAETGYEFALTGGSQWGLKGIVATDLSWYGAALGSAWLMVVAATAAAGITSERECGTWFDLLVTPLEARSIIRAKVRGATRTPRALLYVALTPWLVGLVINALQPISVLTALLALAVFTRFTAELGTFMSLRSRSTVQALAMTIGTLVALNLLAPAVFLPGGLLTNVSPYWLIGCMPVLLVQFPTYPTLGVVLDCLAGYTGWSRLCIPMASLLIYVMGAWYLRRASLSQFDAIADRPRRAP